MVLLTCSNTRKLVDVRMCLVQCTVKKNAKFVNPQQAKQIYRYPAHPDIDQTTYIDG